MNKKLRLGVIGLNQGNGHPYSWSAICNGYDPIAMATCPYPVIPDYLSKQRFPEDVIPDVAVTHIWTQDRSISEEVARASRIAEIVDSYEDMIGAVDAILLARDDPECHAEIAAPFIAAGLPIRLDKMAAPTGREAAAIYDSQTYPGQVQSGSMLRYAPEFVLTDDQRKSIGSIRQVHGMVIKDWARYGVHIVEPALKVIGTQGAVTKCEAWHNDGLANVSVLWESGVQGTFQAVGEAEAPIMMTVVGTKNAVCLSFEDTFRCFKAGLVHFIDGVRHGAHVDDRALTLAAMEVIEAGAK